jgi:diguanylate cyclase (GGDEF)-like protein
MMMYSRTPRLRSRTRPPIVRDRRQAEIIDMRQMENLRVFHDVARALTSTLELEPLLHTIMTKMAEFFGPERWSLMMVDEEKDELYYALSAGMDADKLETLRVKMGEGVAGWVAQTGNPLVVPDVRIDKQWARFSKQHPELRLRSIACLPIRCGERTLGVMQLHNSSLDLLPEYSISFLRVLCDYAAIALQNARHVKLIHHLSITDDCTGLFNARYLYTQLERQIEEATDTRIVPIHSHFSLVFLDLDHFKTINDTHGHLIGSRLLAEVGGLLKRVIGPQHAAFRYGGDEFVMLLRALDKTEATALVREVRNQLNDSRFLTGEGLALTVAASFGLATYPQDGSALHTIIRSADTMMYRVKNTTRNDIAVAHGEIRAVPDTFVVPARQLRAEA